MKKSIWSKSQTRKRKSQMHQVITKTPCPDTSPSFPFFIRGREVKRGQEKRMNPNMKAFIKYLIVAVCSAIVTYLTSSCTAGLVIGKNQRQQQENNISTRADSTHFVPTITIR